jgi:hypothetical protein
VGGEQAVSRKVRRVHYRLDSRGVQRLPAEDVRVILRGADDLIMHGGRSLLVKVLRGSRSKDVLDRSLDESPAYGYYRDLSDDDVLARIDWVILHGYLAIEYDYRLPLLVYTPSGWAIEKETYADELFQRLAVTLTAGPQAFDVGDLKDRNREIILRLLEKVEASGEKRFIPLLEAWEQIDYKKVRQRLRQVIARLSEGIP